MIRLENECIAYGKEVIFKELSLDINPNESVAFIGKSGSGKSTLLKRLFTKEENAAFIPQELGLVENLSVFHNVYMGKLDSYSTLYNLRNLLLPAKKEKALITTVLKSVDLEGMLEKKVESLSGGQKQRVAIARALFAQKKLLLADELISALDINLSVSTLEVVQKHFQGFILALHNVELAQRFCKRIIGIKAGEVVLDKPSAQINQADLHLLYEIAK